MLPSFLPASVYVVYGGYINSTILNTVRVMRKTPTLKQKVFVTALLNKGSKTYLNQTESALEAYNTDDRNVAAAIGSQTLKNPNVRNYLEQRATELGIGIQVRLSNYGEIANAREPRQTVQRRYKKNKEGHLVLASKTVTTVPVKDSDRIKAMQQIDTLTGVKEQREIDKQLAMSEFDALYERIIGNRVVNGTRNIGDDTTDGSDAGRLNNGLADVTEERESTPHLRDRAPGERDPVSLFHIAFLPPLAHI